MKNLFTFLSLLVLMSSMFGQFKEKEQFDTIEYLMKDPKSETLFDMNKFSISHSYSVSYSSSSHNSVAVGEYVAGINYRFSEPLTMKVEIGASHMPYNSLYSEEESFSPDVYLKSATIDYKPTSNTSFRIQFNNYRHSYYNSWNRNRFYNHYSER